jgi:hypothetical protein
MANAFELMTDGAGLGEDRLAAGSVTGHCRDVFVILDDFLAISTAGFREDLLGSFSNRCIFVSQETLPPRGIDLTDSNCLAFDCFEEQAQPVFTAEQKL